MSNDKKTLVILTPGFAKDGSDSTCIPMQQSFIRTLNEKYPRVEVIILALDYPYFKGSYSWSGNIVLTFNNRNRGGFSKFLLRKRVLKELKKLHEAKKIDGILSFWYGECAFIGNGFAHKYKVQHLCWMWGQDAKVGNKYVGKTDLKENQIVVFSDFLQNEFERNYGIRPKHVVTPGIDAKEFTDEPQEKDIDILAAGSLIPLKRYDIFVEVVAEIRKTRPSVQALLIGGGPERKKIEALIRVRGLESTISLAGELPHPEVLRMMQRAKVFLHPSSYEGFGIVSIEALYAGAKVISFVQPMNQSIKNWHIVSTPNEMISKALAILQNGNEEYSQVLQFTIVDSVKSMVKIFSL